jgi:hypothetical protein
MKRLVLILFQGIFLLSSLSALADEGAADTPAASSPSSDSATPAKAKSGLTSVASTIVSSAVEIQKIVQKYSPDGNIAKHVEKLRQYQNQYQNACSTRESTTEMICREKTNPELTAAIPVVQGIMTSISGSMDACSKFAKAMDIMNKALVAYQAACTTTKMLCENSCGTAKQILQQAKDSITESSTTAVNAINKQILDAVAEGGVNTAALTADRNRLDQETKVLIDGIGQDLNAATSDSVANNAITCSNFKNQITSSVVGIVGVLRSLGQANKCSDEQAATANPYATPTPLDCTLAANKPLPECICKAAPRTAGCSTGLDSQATARSADALGAASIGSASAGSAAAPTITAGSGATMAVPPGSESAASTGPGAPVSGGSAMDGGSAGNSGGPGGAAQRGGSRLNPNILSGEGGGGGGGGGSWGGHASGADSGLRKYLPGGEKDPTAMAGAVKPKDVTSPDGKSNWQKVRDRYMDNKPTFLGN